MRTISFSADTATNLNMSPATIAADCFAAMMSPTTTIIRIVMSAMQKLSLSFTAMITNPTLHFTETDSYSTVLSWSRRIKKTECHFTIIKTVIENWKKDGYYSLYQDDIWTWAVQLMYWTINDLPSEFRKEYSIQMLDLMKTYDVEEYLVSGSEVSHYKEFKKWAESNTSSESDLNLIKKKIEQENFEIEETLKSKAFKLGKFFTGKKKRLNIDKIIEA